MDSCVKYKESVDRGVVSVNVVVIREKKMSIVINLTMVFIG